MLPNVKSVFSSKGKQIIDLKSIIKTEVESKRKRSVKFAEKFI